MSNFRKFISMSAVAVLAGTNLLAPLSYADAATAWASLVDTDFERNPLQFEMPDDDVYLYAVTEPNNYYVEFHGNTGTGTMEKQTFTYDAPQNLNPNAFTKTGYTYSGWNTDANGGGSGYADEQEVKNLAETGTVNMYAQWNVNSYDITYDLNDRTGSSSGVHTPTPTGHVNYGVSFPVAEPTRTGYDFSGWNISNMNAETSLIDSEPTNASSVNNSKGHSFESLRATSGTVAFVAQWSAQKTPYKVEHWQESLEGTYPAVTETDNLSGDTDTEAIHSSKNYVGFGDPEITKDPANGNINADESTVITYKYPRSSYELTLDFLTGVASVTAAGTVTASETFNADGTKSFKYDEPITLTATPADGYEVITWGGYSGTNTSFNMPSTNETKTVTATPIEYTITQQCRGGDGCVETTTYTIESGNITLPTPTRDDYSIFEGWTGGVNNEITIPTSPITVTGGSINNRIYSAVWSCTGGYHLVETGQSTESCQPDTNVQYLVNHKTQDLENPDSYTIVDSGYMYGTSNTQTQIVAKDYTGFTLSGNIASYQTKIDKDGNTVVDVLYNRDSYDYEITAPAGGVAATAITSSGADGANSHGSQIKYEDEVKLNADMAPGYEFDYWEVKDASNNPVTVTNSGQIDGATFTMPASSVTITPHLKQTSFEITYVLNSGSVAGTNPTSYTVESGNITLIDPTRDHSVFLGWSGGGHAGMFSGDEVAIAKGSTGDKTFTANWGCDAGYHAEGNRCVANEYTINVNYDDSDKTNTGITVTYDKFETIPNPSKSGYIFSGWTITGMSGDVTHYIGSESDTTTATSATGVMGDEFKNLTTDEHGTVTFTAEWRADVVEYKVHHMIEGLDVDTYSQTGQDETHTGKSDSSVTFTDLDITLTGFTYSGGNLSGGQTWPNAVKTETTIDRHGTTHIYLYYDRNRHTVTTAHDDGVLSTSGDGTYDFEHAVTVSAQVKSGYHFVQWTGTPAPAPTSTSVTP